MVTIHKLKLEEIAEVKKLLSHTWIDTYGEFLSQKTIDKVTSVWHDPKLLLSQARSSEVFFGVAKDEKGRIVGLITIRKIDTSTLMMYRLYVHPHHQRKGIGSKLIQESLKVFANSKKIRLEVEEFNKKGHSFYLKHGFKEIERKVENVEAEVMNVIVMEKLL